PGGRCRKSGDRIGRRVPGGRARVRTGTRHRRAASSRATQRRHVDCGTSGRHARSRREPAARRSVLMVEIREILCPIDFSETSRRALEHATIVAGWYKSRLTALHVMHTPLFPAPPIFVAGFADAPTAPAVPDRRAREDELRAWLEPARQAGLETDVLVVEGNTAARILEQASARKSDLIVIGTEGLGGVERFMLGSVAETVLRQGSCPVMTVPPTAALAARIPYTRLLCPVDFSEPSL